MLDGGGAPGLGEGAAGEDEAAGVARLVLDKLSSSSFFSSTKSGPR